MKALLLEDDIRLAGLISRGLRRDGHAVDMAATVEDARWLATESVYDVLVLDVMLPDGDGFGLCRELRSKGDWTPVLLLTARDAIDDRVRGLDVGADDYLVKPFAFAELFARLRALARRGSSERPNVLESGDLRLDPGSREVHVGRETLSLAGREFALLEYFLRHEGEVLTRSRIIDEVWDWAFEGTPNLIVNAITYGPPGAEVEVVAHVEPQPEPGSVGALLGRAAVLSVEVLDRGPGVPAEIASQVFEPFHRGPNAIGPGTGLGLATAAAAVRAHHGSIGFEPRNGGGTRFWIRLPV
jgi:two-component system OmpR family response regulator